MRTLIFMAALTLVAGCKSKDNGTKEATPAAPSTVEGAPPAAPAGAPVAAAPATGVKLPGDCVPIPSNPTMDKADFDGDGVDDALVEDQSQHCDKYECPKVVYVVRGKCAHVVGTMSIGYSAKLKVLPTKSNGLSDVSVDGLGGSATYSFDGTSYVAKKVEKAMIGKDDKPATIVANLERATDPTLVRALLADKVVIDACNKKQQLDREAAAQWLDSNMVYWLSKVTCQASCCDLAPGDDQASGRDVGVTATRVCAVGGQVTEIHTACSDMR